jgi:hypothetical protein
MIAAKLHSTMCLAVPGLLGNNTTSIPSMVDDDKPRVQGPKCS